MSYLIRRSSNFYKIIALKFRKTEVMPQLCTSEYTDVRCVCVMSHRSALFVYSNSDLKKRKKENPLSFVWRPRVVSPWQNWYSCQFIAIFWQKSVNAGVQDLGEILERFVQALSLSFSLFLSFSNTLGKQFSCQSDVDSTLLLET